MKGRNLLSVILNNWPAKILSVVAAIILFVSYRIGTLEERYFTVPLQVEVNEDYMPSSPYPRSARVNLRGRSADIFRILEEDIVASVDFTGNTSEGVFRSPVIVEKKGSAADVNLEIRVEPLDVTIEMERRVKKSLEVFPNMTGTPLRGYELSRFYLSPTSVEVVGPASKLVELTTVLTEEIDLSGKDDDFTARVRVGLSDAYVQLSGSDVVEFTAVIDETILLQKFEGIDIVLIDLNSRFSVQRLPTAGSLSVQGSQLFLESLGSEDFLLSVDCSSINRPGVYTLPLIADSPPGLLLLGIEPSELSITITVDSSFPPGAP